MITCLDVRVYGALLLCMLSEVNPFSGLVQQCGCWRERPGPNGVWTWWEAGATDDQGAHHADAPKP